MLVVVRSPIAYHLPDHARVMGLRGFFVCAARGPRPHGPCPGFGRSINAISSSSANRRAFFMPARMSILLPKIVADPLIESRELGPQTVTMRHPSSLALPSVALSSGAFGTRVGRSRSDASVAFRGRASCHPVAAVGRAAAVAESPIAGWRGQILRASAMRGPTSAFARRLLISASSRLAATCATAWVCPPSRTWAGFAARHRSGHPVRPHGNGGRRGCVWRVVSCLATKDIRVAARGLLLLRVGRDVSRRRVGALPSPSSATIVNAVISGIAPRFNPYGFSWLPRRTDPAMQGA